MANAQLKVSNNVTVGVRMNPALREAAVAVARQNDLPVSTVINAALYAFLRGNSQKALVAYLKRQD